MRRARMLGLAAVLAAFATGCHQPAPPAPGGFSPLQFARKVGLGPFAQGRELPLGAATLFGYSDEFLRQRRIRRLTFSERPAAELEAFLDAPDAPLHRRGPVSCVGGGCGFEPSHPSLPKGLRWRMELRSPAGLGPQPLIAVFRTGQDSTGSASFVRYKDQALWLPGNAAAGFGAHYRSGVWQGAAAEQGPEPVNLFFLFCYDGTADLELYGLAEDGAVYHGRGVRGR